MTRTPNIIINGYRLSRAQTMALRAAIEEFTGTLQKGLYDKRLGEQIAKDYKDRIDEIRNYIYRYQPPPPPESS